MVKEFLKAKSPAEAARLKEEKRGSQYFSGGTLINSLEYEKQPQVCISLEELGLKAVTKTPEGVILGAFLTLQELIDHVDVPEPVKKGAGHVYSRNIRNMATLGGNIGGKRGYSALIPILIAMGAELETQEEGTVPVWDYVKGESESLILSVRVPRKKGAAVVRKVAKSAGAYPVITAGVYILEDGGKVDEAVIALGGIAPKVERLTSLEEALKEGALKNNEEISDFVSAIVKPETDFLGSAEYKKYISGVTVAHCISICRGEV